MSRLKGYDPALVSDVAKQIAKLPVIRPNIENTING